MSHFLPQRSVDSFPESKKKKKKDKKELSMPLSAAKKLPSEEEVLHPRSPLAPDSTSHGGSALGGGESVSKRLGASNSGGVARSIEAFEVEAGGGATIDAPSSSPSSSSLPVGNDLDRKLNRHLLPALCCLSVVNYIDRTNLAFAASGLKRDVGISLKEYGEGGKKKGRV